MQVNLMGVFRITFLPILLIIGSTHAFRRRNQRDQPKTSCIVGGGMSSHCALAALENQLQFGDWLASGRSPGKRSTQHQKWTHPPIARVNMGEKRFPSYGRTLFPMFGRDLRASKMSRRISLSDGKNQEQNQPHRLIRKSIIQPLHKRKHVAIRASYTSLGPLGGSFWDPHSR